MELLKLTEQQWERLRKLEGDPGAKVVGRLRLPHVGDCPVVLHSGIRRSGYKHLAVMGPNGRLTGLGPTQERRFLSRRVIVWLS